MRFPDVQGHWTVTAHDRAVRICRRRGLVVWRRRNAENTGNTEGTDASAWMSAVDTRQDSRNRTRNGPVLSGATTLAPNTPVFHV
jgi:hypothetical protein